MLWARKSISSTPSRSRASRSTTRTPAGPVRAGTRSTESDVAGRAAPASVLTGRPRQIRADQDLVVLGEQLRDGLLLFARLLVAGRSTCDSHLHAEQHLGLIGRPDHHLVDRSHLGAAVLL